MPLVAAPIAVLITLLIFMMAISYQIWLRPHLEEMAEQVPVIGSRIRGYVRGISDATAGRMERWARAGLNELIEWLWSLADHIWDRYEATADFAVRVASSVHHLATVKAPALIRAALRPVVSLIAAVRADLDALEGWARAQVRSIDARADRFERDLYERAIRGIDRLRTETIPALRRDVTHGIDRIDGVLDRRVLPGLRGLEAKVPGLETGLAGLRRLWERTDSWVQPVATVFTAAAVIELLRHVRTCRSKTERLCNTDPQYLDELLGLALVLPHLDEIRGIVRVVAHGMHDLADEFGDSLRD